MKYILISLLIISNVWAKESDCYLSNAIMGYNQLKCLNKHVIASEIRRNFIEAQKRSIECKHLIDCVDVFPNATKYLNLIKEKFIIISFNKNGFGGKFIYILFKNSKMLHRVWIYPVDEGFYQVREFKEMNPSDDFKKEIPSLISDPQILSLWR